MVFLIKIFLKYNKLINLNTYFKKINLNHN